MVFRLNWLFSHIANKVVATAMLLLISFSDWIDGGCRVETVEVICNLQPLIFDVYWWWCSKVLTVSPFSFHIKTNLSIYLGSDMTWLLLDGHNPAISGHVLPVNLSISYIAYFVYFPLMFNIHLSPISRSSFLLTILCPHPFIMYFFIPFFRKYVLSLSSQKRDELKT